MEVQTLLRSSVKTSHDGATWEARGEPTTRRWEQAEDWSPDSFAMFVLIISTILAIIVTAIPALPEDEDE